MDATPTGNTVMKSQILGRCLICLSVLLVITGFVGVGSTQQAPTATTVNTTTTAGNTTEEMTDTVSPSANSTTSAQPRTTPDANDEWQNATPIETNRTINGTLPAGDQDWSVFTLDSSESITVRLVASNRTNLSGFLYNHEGDLLDSSYVSPSEEISLTGNATTSGQYYIFVRNEGDALGAYAFNISVSESGTATEAMNVEQTQSADENSSSGSGPGFGLFAGITSVILFCHLFAEIRREDR